MATLVLTAVGGVLGGPVGAAIGGLIGQSADREWLFALPTRQGPRLTELAVQTSSYGTPIPKLFGTIRVAGSVIWSTDLIETVTEDEGGKGAPDSVRYSYSASFAVLLSGRPIRAVRRIWADGKLLRGAAGDFKSPTGFRLHRGSETQMPDPLIAAARGMDGVPAHRGCAVAVFEDMALADYANRIPSLTFEVEADAGSIDIGSIAATLSEGRVAAEADILPLDGFAAQGGSQRAVLDSLAEASGAWIAPDGVGVRMRRGDGPVRTIADSGWHADGDATRCRERSIAPSDQVPKSLTIRHYDPARDYQAGLQRATRAGAGVRHASVDLPAVVSAARAKALAAQRLDSAGHERVRRTVQPGRDAIDIAPGARVAVAGTPGTWRVRSATIERGAVTLTLSPVTEGGVVAAADPGSFVGAIDALHGPTILQAFELAPLDGSLAETPIAVVAATGREAGWRRAAVLASSDGGASWQAIGGTRGAAVIGRVTRPPEAASAAVEDRSNAIEVTLAHEAMVLAGADDARLVAGANLAMVGEELIQFGKAEPLGGARWRLTQLWRGRRGSEAAIGAHVAGERFVLLQPARLLPLPLPAISVGAGPARIVASGVGDGDTPAEASIAIDGRSFVPPAPVHLRAEEVGDGSVRLHWVRRSRIGWDWIDGSDAPLGEEREAYRATFDDGGAAIEVTTPAMIVPATRRMSGVAIELRQIGTRGLSPAARIVIGPWRGETE